MSGHVRSNSGVWEPNVWIDDWTSRQEGLLRDADVVAVPQKDRRNVVIVLRVLGVAPPPPPRKRTDYARKAVGQARLERKWRFHT